MKVIITDPIAKAGVKMLQDEVRRICLETGQTTFMITHDVDEAIYLADKIILRFDGVEPEFPHNGGKA